ncbi:MAG: HypC/HybG/HupF family hydrogenase formation chaperone, partial [Planctomycetota bacterium]
MCLAVPARVIEKDGDRAVADAMGNRWNIRITLTPDIEVGDVVLIHAGYAITKVDE